jgi:hypothetical protein
MYLYKADDATPIWDGKQVARLRTFIATNGLTGQLRLKAVNLQNGLHGELLVNRFDGNLYDKIETIHARVKAL